MDTVTLSVFDVAMLMALVAKINPNEYNNPTVKAAIYKAKAAIASKPKNIRLVP